MTRPAVVEITAEGLDRIPGAAEGDRFEVKLFSPAADNAGEVAHVLDAEGSTWSLGVGDWRPVAAAELVLERRIEIRGDGFDVRAEEDGKISLRVQDKGDDDDSPSCYVHAFGTSAEVRAFLARALALVNAVDRAASALELESSES